MKRNTKAFTLVELVIVIAVIAVLAAVMIPTFGGLIKSAQKSADESDLASLNTQLAIMKIETEADLRDVIKATFPDKADDFAPRTAKYGYHFWYDAEQNKFVLGTYDEVDNAPPVINTAQNNVEDATVTLGLTTELASSTATKNEIFQKNCKTSYRMFKDRHFILDNGGSEVGEALAALDAIKDAGEANVETVKENIVNAFEEIATIIDPAKNSNAKPMAQALVNRVETVAIVSNHITFVYDVDKVENIHVTAGTETISSNIVNKEGVRQEYIATVDKFKGQTVVLPDSIQEIKESAFKFEGTEPTTVEVKVSFEINNDTVANRLGADATNATIVVVTDNDVKVNITIDVDIVYVDNTKLETTLAPANKATEFEIRANENYAIPVDDQSVVYIPYGKGGVTLYADSFVFENTDKAALKNETVRWSIVGETDLISIDKNGKVTINRKPQNDEKPAKVRATAVAGGLERELEIRFVLITDMDVTVAGDLVDLAAANPYKKISYTGETLSFDFTVGNFQTNFTGIDASNFDTTVTYVYDNDIFTIENGKLTLKMKSDVEVYEGERNITVKVGPADDPYLTQTITVEIKDAYYIPLSSALPYSGQFNYRVGNGNAVNLSVLLASKKASESMTLKIKDKGAATGGVMPDIGTVDGSSFNATYTSSLTRENWASTTVKFTGVGLAAIVIDGVEVLTLEVVNGTNYFEGSTLPASAASHIVLLGNVRVRTAAEIGTDTDTQKKTSALSLSNACLFGNGFVIDATNTTNTAIGIISLSNGAMLDNAIVIGSIYTTYKAESGNGQEWSTSLVFVNNGGTISNSYLSNTKAPVRVGEGITTISNTTISGGCYANIDVRSGSELILEDMTLINQVGGTAPSKNALGLGVVVHEDVGETKVVIKGNLIQYNAIGSKDKDYMAASNMKTYFGYMDDADPYTVGGVTYVDAGIISLTDKVGNFVDFVDADQAVIDARGDAKNVGSGRYLWHMTATAGAAAYNAAYKYENTWQQNGYTPNAQGDIPPTYQNILTTTKQGEDAYCYFDGSTIKIGFAAGGSRTLTLSQDVFNITDSIGNKLNLKTITLDGATIADTYTFTKAGPATLKVSVELNGKTYYYSVKINVSITSYSKGSVSLGSNTVTITGSSSKDYYVVFDILKSVTITDVDVNGVTKTQTINNTLPAGWTIALDETGYIVTVTTDWPNINGEPTKLVITASASGTGTPTNWTLTCDGNKGCPANSLHSCYQKAANGSVTPTATFVYYGFNGEASTSVKLTGSTTMGSPKHTVSSCVTPDTLVTLADGTQKQIQYVTAEDMLLVWNHFTGKYDVVPAAIIFNHGYGNNTLIKLNFSDGTQVKAVNLHQFLDADLKQYVSISADTVAQYVGHNFVKQSGEDYTTVTLESYEISVEYIEAYGIISALHYNIFVEGMFSTDFMENDYDLFNYFTIGEGMVYDAEQMQEDIETYGLYTYEDFADYLSYEQFVGFNVQYFKIAVGKGLYTYEGVLDLINEYLSA